jgi:phosphate transport system substrate-binding protein
MSNTKLRALLGGSVAVLSLGAAAAAQAAPVTVIPATAAVTIYGGGSTLVQPYARQAEDCFGTPAPTWDKSTPPVATNEPPFNFTGSPAQNCATTHTDVKVTLQYQGVGSGGGILGLFTHDPHNLNSGGNFTASGAAAFWPTEHYAASDLPLAAADVDVYNNGGTNIPTPAKATDIQGSNNPDGTILNPLANYGALVQFPLLVAPVSVAYSPIYKEIFNTKTHAITNYRFHLAAANLVVGGTTFQIAKLKLSSQTYCEIFNGIITNWNDARIAATNTYVAPAGGITVGGVTFAAGSTVNTIEDATDPTPAASFSVPIELVGRSDSSGTTGIFTRHLQAECAKALPAGENNVIVAGPTLPTSQIANGNGGPGSGLFTVENGSGALASYMAFVPPTASAPTSVSGKVGYLGPDFVRPYSPTPSGILPAALANNKNHTFVFPTSAGALAAFGSLAPPESNAGGGYVPATNPSAPHRNQPYAWVEPLSSTSPIATAGDTVTGAYPIVGTSNFLGYTCYADTKANSANNVGLQLNQFLNWYEDSDTVISATASAPGILALRGFAAVPYAWRVAIKQTFVTPTTGTNGTNALHLWISSKTNLGTQFVHNTVCNSLTGA